MAMYPYVALRCPTYRENSHANHTWNALLLKTACFIAPGTPSVWVGFPSPAPSSGNARPRRATKLGQHVDPVGRSWESTLRGRRSHGLTYPRIPRGSHLQ
jgi:hypothetical protein